MSDVPLISLEDAAAEPRGETCVWSTASVRKRVEQTLPFPVHSSFELPPGTKTLIVVGGGTLIDEAKAWRGEHAPDLRLIAIPSLWGSGAEVSPIAVRNRGDRKDILIDPRLLPSARVIWPELAETVEESRARWACGDSWAHALEGFLSPLGDEESRERIAPLLIAMAKLPLAFDEAWFEMSARACAAQSRTSVGLVHGIAHILEGQVRAAHPDQEWGHARLCALFLWPVMRFNEAFSPKWPELACYGVDTGLVLEILRRLWEREAYIQILPFMETHWMSILRDPCSRTNSALVRPSSLAYFKEMQFS